MYLIILLFKIIKTIQFCSNQNCHRRGKGGILMQKTYKEDGYCNIIHNKGKLKEKKDSAKQYDIVKCWQVHIKITLKYHR